MHYDLDLVLIEYYKKRLDSQQKNREKSTNQLDLTELTETTGLQLPTDWTPYNKPSSLRPSFFPSSPLPFFLSLSSNFSLLFTTPITSLTFFQRSTPLPFAFYLSIEFGISEITSITDETKMTKQGTPTRNSIPLTLVIQISYIMAMRYLGIPSTCFFKGFNNDNFFC